MPGFTLLNQTSLQLAARILADWEPLLTELASRTRWFNLGEDSLIFLRLDDREFSFLCFPPALLMILIFRLCSPTH